MLNQELVASNNSFVWNGTKPWRKDDVKAKFEAIEEDSTKLKMTISGIVPSSNDDIQLVVDVYPQSDEIQYQGKVENSDYDMTVSGIYFPSKSVVGHYFKLKVEYNVVKDDLLKQPFTFNFKKGCTIIKSGDAIFMTIDGVEYAYSQLAESTLSGMTSLYAKTDYQDTKASLTKANTYRLTYAGKNETLGTYTISQERVSGGLPYISIPLASTADVHKDYKYDANLVLF